jgi:GT2 family glycosyltransferase
VIIPLRDRPELLERCVARLRATVVHPAWELVLVDNASREPATLALLDELAAEGATVVRYPHEFHFARQVDLGAEAARGEVLAFLNNDAVAEGPGWFEEMLGHALRPEVGLVGARMHTETGYTQHEGIVLGVGGVAWNLRAGHHGLWNRTVRDAAGVTAAAAMVRAEVFRAVGGFDDQLRVANNDVDLGLRIGAGGWRVLYTPWARLTHAESASRGPLHPPEDERRFIARWGAAGTLRDPFWDVNLDIPEVDLLAI